MVSGTCQRLDYSAYRGVAMPPSPSFLLFDEAAEAECVKAAKQGLCSPCLAVKLLQFDS
jgi:hypothetical protein